MSKKNKENSNDELKISKDDKVLVVLESVRDEIKLIAEGVSVVHKELKDFKNEMYEFKNEMYEFKNEMYEFRNEMYEFRNQTEANFKVVFNYQTATDDHIELNFKKVFNEIKDIKKRLTRIENILSKDKKKIVKVQDEIKEIKKDIRNNRKQTTNRVALQQFKILEKRVEKLEIRIKTK